MIELKDTPCNYPVVESREVLHGHVFSMVTDQVKYAESVAQRDYVKHPGAVAIVPLRMGVSHEDAAADSRRGTLVEEPQVLLINQFRHPVGMTLWKIPAGLTDVSGEDLLSAAQRELVEETDLRAGRWDVLVDYFTTPGGSTEALRVYLARDLTELQGKQQNFVREDEEAFMSSCWVPLSEAVAAIFSGDIHNPSAVVGLLATAHFLEHPMQPLRDAQAPFSCKHYDRQTPR